MKQIVAAVLLLAATAVNGQCNFNDMTVSLGSQTLKGASLAGAGVTVGVVAPLAACTGFVATTSQCTLQAANYNGGVAITVTCTGSTWGPAVLSADPCAAMAPAIANAGTITGNEGDTKPVVCNSGFTCDQATCNVICTANAFTFVTQTPAVTALPTCIQDCTLLPLAGASLSGCTAGGTLVDMTIPGAPTCTWNMDAGFDCGGMTTGAITCTAGTLAGAPTCTENVCAVYDLGTAPAGLIAGPNQGMVLPCTAMTVLTAVTQPSCSLQCDSSAGYTTNTGLLNCDALNMGTGVVATPSITCAPVQCLQPFDHAAAGIVDPAMTLPSCNNVFATPCSLVCDGNGFAQGGAVPALTCTQDSSNPDVGNWVLTNPCLGPATCAIYTCPHGLVLDANPTAINCPQVTRGGTPIAAICSALHADNTAACCLNPTSVPTAIPTAQPTAVPPFMPTAVPTSAPSTCTDKDTIKTTCPRSLPDTCRFKVQHQERVLSVAFSSDGTHFATGSDDGVRVFEIATGLQTLKLACADFAVHDVVFSPDALSVAVAGAGGRAVVCDVATGALRYVLHNLGSKSTPIRKVAYSRVGGLLAGGGGNAPSTRVVRADDGALDLVIHAHARNVAFSPDGSLLATVVGSEVDEIVQIWDVATGAKVGTVVSEGARVVSVAFLSGGELLRGMDSGAVLMTRWASGTVGVGVATVSAAVSMPSHVLHHATPSADGQLFAAAGPAEVVVWTAAGTVHTRLAGLDSIVAQVSFSPDSSLLATAGHDGSLLVWSLV